MSKLHGYLQKKTWDTRIAAGHAVAAIAEATPAGKGDLSTRHHNLLSLEDIDIERVIESGARLLSSDTQIVEEAVDAKQSKSQLERNLGLDERVTRHLGGTEAVVGVSELDLALNRSTSIYSTMTVEKAVDFVRQESKSGIKRQGSFSDAPPSKTVKVKEEVDCKDVVDDVEDKESHLLAEFYALLIGDLWHPDWEIRHGATVGLREVLKSHAKRQSADLLEDLVTRLVCILALDQLSDFVSDEVLAPVRETCGQVLGVVCRELANQRLQAALAKLLILSQNAHWMISYGGLLGIKYILASCVQESAALLPVVYSEIFHHIEHPKDDDVMASAVSALLPVSHILCSLDVLRPKLPRLRQVLWQLLRSLDELSPATNSILKMLSVVQTPHEDKVESIDLEAYMNTLLPFLYHSLPSVRRSCLSATLQLAQFAHASHNLPPAALGLFLLQIFQRALLEESKDIQQDIVEVWKQFLEVFAVSDLSAAFLGYLDLSLCFCMQPSRSPFHLESFRVPVPLSRSPVKDAKPCEFFIAGSSSLGEGDAAREAAVLEARLSSVRLLGLLFAKILSQDSTCYSDVTGVLEGHLESKQALRRMVAALFLVQLGASGQQVTLARCQRLQQLLCRTLQEVLYYEEILLPFKQMQMDCKGLVASLTHQVKVQLPAACSPGGVLSLDVCKNLVGPLCDRLSEEQRNEVKTQISTASLSVEKCGHLHALYNNRVQTLLASAAALFIKQLPEKSNPILKPLMESVRNEAAVHLQELAARALAEVVWMLAAQGSLTVCEKVVKNLTGYLNSQPLPEPASEEDILSVSCEKLSADSVQVIGAQLALRAICARFGANLETSLPPLWHLLKEIPLRELSSTTPDYSKEFKSSLVLIDCCLKSLDAAAFKDLHSALLPLLLADPGPLSLPDPSLRLLVTRVLCSTAELEPGVRVVLVRHCLTWCGRQGPLAGRLGAAELAYLLTGRLGLGVLPFLSLLLLPLLACMSDPCPTLRAACGRCFGLLLRLLPLEAGAEVPAELAAEAAERRRFLDCLLRPQLADPAPLPVPVRATLRPYQQDSVNWLAFLRKFGLHGVLADDLGLGKTLQAICALSSDHHDRKKRCEELGSREDGPLPSLVVCPATLTGHWEYEVRKFVSPEDLSTYLIVGNKEARKNLMKSFIASQDGEELGEHDLVVASYDSLRKDTDLFSSVSWNYCILDEGHVIKNPKSKLSLAVKSLRARHRLVLTGTPVQNGVQELWAIFDFLMPGYLGTEAEFSAAFTRPIQQSREPKATAAEQSRGAEALEALHRQTLPFMLRRLKEDVLKDLPPKIIQDYPCELTPVQAKLYASFCDSCTFDDSAKQHVFQALQYLRKLCNHPCLVPDPSRPQNARAPREIGLSGKLLALRQLLCDVGLTGDARQGVVSPHRLLIFAQTRAVLDLVEELVLKGTEVTSLRLDGSVPLARRHDVVLKFNADPSIDALLLTTSVGGLGLNLTGADTVVFVDHDWNPMKDLQAMDRAHRLGQTRSVSVYRLVTKDTLEEKIMSMQEFKLAVAGTIVNADNSSTQSLDTGKVLDLFEFSASGGDKDKKSRRGRPKKAKEASTSITDLLVSSSSLQNEDMEEEFDMKSFVETLQ